MRKEKELNIFLEFMDTPFLAQKHFNDRKESFGSEGTVSRILNLLGDKKVLIKKLRQEDHKAVNYWSLEKNADSFKHILNEFLGSEEEYRKKFLNHAYFWEGLKEFKDEISLPLFWKIADFCLSTKQAALKFVLSDLNMNASRKWIPKILGFLARKDPYHLELTNKQIESLQRVCLFPRVLEGLIEVLKDNEWLDKPISFFENSLFLEKPRRPEDTYKFLLFAELFVNDAFRNLRDLSHQCQDQCQELLDRTSFDESWQNSVFSFSDELSIGSQEPPFTRGFCRQRNVFCPQCEKPIVFGVWSERKLLDDLSMSYIPTAVCGYCGVEVQYGGYPYDVIEYEKGMFANFPDWATDKNIIFIRMKIEVIKKGNRKSKSFVAINEKDAAELKIIDGDTLIVKTYTPEMNDIECLSFVTRRLDKGTIAVFENPYWEEGHDTFCEEPWDRMEGFIIYQNISSMSRIVRKLPEQH